MKSALVSSCLVSAALAAPFASRAGSTTIQMKTGDGDASVQVTVPFDTVFSTASRFHCTPAKYSAINTSPYH